MNIYSISDTFNFLTFSKIGGLVYVHNNDKKIYIKMKCKLKYMLFSNISGPFIDFELYDDDIETFKRFEDKIIDESGLSDSPGFKLLYISSLRSNLLKVSIMKKDGVYMNVFNSDGEPLIGSKYIKESDCEIIIELKYILNTDKIIVLCWNLIQLKYLN